MKQEEQYLLDDIDLWIHELNQLKKDITATGGRPNSISVLKLKRIVKEINKDIEGL